MNNYESVRLCLVFGSTASGKAVSKSDVDVAVAAAEPLSVDTRMELMEALSLALKRPVDLVDLTTASGPILRVALSKGRVLKNQDKLLYARLISRMLFNQTDMMPYYNRILKERRRRYFDGKGRH